MKMCQSIHVPIKNEKNKIKIPKIHHNGKSGTGFNVVNKWGGLRCHIRCHIELHEDVWSLVIRALLFTSITTVTGLATDGQTGEQRGVGAASLICTTQLRQIMHRYNILNYSC